MCLIISRGFHPELKPYLVDSDMVVYKIIGLDNKSEIFEFQYEPNTKYHLPTPMVPDAASYSDSATFVIQEGWHAWRVYPSTLENQKVVKFVIPAGSLVFFDIDDKRIVSDTIISGDLEAE